jgi:L-lysine 2,3-aminomutase
LFDQVCAGGKSVALIADLSHPRELEPEPARAAVRRIRGTGTVIYAEGTLAGTVNDAPGVWAAQWRVQVRLGVIPRTMILVPVTGPGTHFRVTLARAQQIFAGA